MIGQIELTDSETALYAEVSEAERLLLVNHNAQRARQAGEASKKLFRSLFERGAIPKPRLRYFADSEYNAHNPRASRRELFLRNAHTEDAMYAHPQFWRYLLYFINGADLPRAVVADFQKISQDEFRDHDALASLARRTSRALPEDRGSKAEEFFKLAIDCGCPLSEAPRRPTSRHASTLRAVPSGQGGFAVFSSYFGMLF